MLEQETEELNVPGGDDQLDLNLGEEQGAEVEISEDGQAEIKASTEEDKPQEDANEHEEYSHRVKKRLDKMTAKLREAERREQAALEYARQVQANLQVAQARTQSLDQGYATEFKSRVDSQMAIAEANLQDAIERGDGKAVVDAQKLLSSLVFEQQRAQHMLAQRQQEVQQPVQQQQYAQQPVQQAPRGPDPKAEAWAEKNEWFGADTVMTHAAFGIHTQLKEEGFDLSSDEYYDELDRRVRKEFPHKFKRQQASVQSTAPDVAPATRGITTGVNGRRTIKLTPSEVAIARKLGVPLEEYAKHVRRTA
jgi:hypothetical protein